MTPASRASTHYCLQAKTPSREEGGPPLVLLAVSQVAEGEGEGEKEEEEEGGDGLLSSWAAAETDLTWRVWDSL